MNNDSDYGGTYNIESKQGQSGMDSLPTIVNSGTMEGSLNMDIKNDNIADQSVEQMESLENPDYTDSVTSNESGKAFLARDKNKIWEDSETGSEDDNANIHLLENPAYIDSVTSTENPLASLLKGEQEKEYTCIQDDETLFQEFIEGSTKGFEISIVEIVPNLHDELKIDTPLWESNAYIDEFSCPSPGVRRLERVCKNAIINLSQDLSCKSSMKGSTLLPVLINQVPDPVPMEEESFFEGNEIKNLLVISVSVALMNAAFSSLRNLQSSLNHDGGVGLYSLTGSMAAFTLLSLFTPSLIQQFRPKRCLILSIFAHLLYVAANVTPNFYILVPASVLQGAASALMWNAVSTYVTYLARSTAIRNDKRTVHVAGKYFGVFFCFFQLSVVAGNLISSIVLNDQSDATNKTISTNTDLKNIVYKSISNLNDSMNMDIKFSNLSKYEQNKLSICGSKYCHSYPIELGGLTEATRYNLLGIYGVATVLALILPLFLMDRLKNYRTSKINIKHIANQAIAVLRCIVEPRFLTCFIMFFYSNMELGFVMAEVTKAFVTCPLGIHMVGYTMICFGICGSISSFVSGKLEKHVGNVSLISAATIIDLVLLGVMLVWQPGKEHLYLYFLLLGAWGVGDGIWMSQVNCVISRIFPDKLEEAFASLRVVNGLGMTMGFAYASSVCMTYKIYILLAICLSGTVVYVVSEIVRKCRADKKEKEDGGDWSIDGI